MEESTRRLCAALAAIIADEMEAQVAMKRALDEMPDLIADRILDHFDVTPREFGS